MPLLEHYNAISLLPHTKLTSCQEKSSSLYTITKSTADDESLVFFLVFFCWSFIILYLFVFLLWEICVKMFFLSSSLMSSFGEFFFLLLLLFSCMMRKFFVVFVVVFEWKSLFYCFFRQHPIRNDDNGVTNGRKSHRPVFNKRSLKTLVRSHRTKNMYLFCLSSVVVVVVRD